MKRVALAMLTVGVAALAGCNIDFPDLFGWTTPETEQAKLRQFTTDDELKSYLIGQNQQQRSGFLGATDGPRNFDDMDLAADGAAPPAVPSPTGGESNDAGNGNSADQSDFSTTTEQEEGVQEADVIKSDGTYLYVLSRNALRIVQAVPAGELAEVGALELDGYAREMFLVGDQVVAITTPETHIFLDAPVGVAADVEPSFAPYRPQAEIAVIDVTDRSQPSVVSRARLDGSINASRMIDRRLHLVVVNYPDVYAMPLLGPAEARTTVSSFEELTLDDLLPDIRIEVGGEEKYSGNIAEVAEHYRPVDPDGLGLTSVVSVDIDDPENYTAQSVVAYPANVYVSTQALYMTDTEYTFGGDWRQTTDIYKFALTDAGVVQTAAGTVSGRVLNQYSMSEYEGHLRVATTTGNAFGVRDGASSQNNVYVLAQDGEALTTVGSVEGLAPGETIYSARFIGPRGYLVTFEQIDPLFTLDLSDPAAPKTVGELKVPGFSTFIMPMGENHLLTIGRDTNDESGFTFADGIRVSVFDVTDFANPTLAHHEVVGEHGGWSEALYNPKAFTYFAAGEMLCFPVEDYGRGGFAVDVDVDDDGTDTDGGNDSGGQNSNSSDGDAGSNGAGDEPDAPPPADDSIDIGLPPAPTDYFRGLYVYHVTAADGFEMMGRISTVRDDQPYYYGSQFTRGAFIGDVVYAISSEGVIAADVADVETVVSEVDFPTNNEANDNGSMVTEPSPGSGEPMKTE